MFLILHSNWLLIEWSERPSTFPKHTLWKHHDSCLALTPNASRFPIFSVIVTIMLTVQHRKLMHGACHGAPQQSHYLWGEGRGKKEEREVSWWRDWGRVKGMAACLCLTTNGSRVNPCGPYNLMERLRVHTCPLATINCGVPIKAIGTFPWAAKCGQTSTSNAHLLIFYSHL